MPDYQDNSDQIYKKLYRFFLDREIADFYKFLNTLEESLSIKGEIISSNINLADSNINKRDENNERRKELINLEVEGEQVKGFTNLLRQSFLTSLYSFMELWLIRECHLDSRRRDGGVSYKALKGTGLIKVKKYFIGVMKSNYSFGSSQDWIWINNFRLLRDCIVHRQGSLTGFSNFEKDVTLAKFVTSENGLNLFGVDNNQVFIEYEFCLKAMQTVHKFMLELLAL
jgi:hypothetical protein